MKRNNKKIKILFILLLLSIILLLGCLLILPVFPFTQQGNKIESSQDTEVKSETESEIAIETEQPDEENLSTETIATKPLTYIEKCELDYVEPPVKRTRQEAVEKLKELSRWFPGLYLVYQNEALYPEPLLLAAAGNPEMTDFMVGFLTADGSTNGMFRDDEQPEDYPLLLQWDPRWGYMTYGTLGNMGSSGCGPTCLSMAVFYLTGNRDYTPDAVARFSLDNEYYVKNVGTS